MENKRQDYIHRHTHMLVNLCSEHCNQLLRSFAQWSKDISYHSLWYSKCWCTETCFASILCPGAVAKANHLATYDWMKKKIIIDLKTFLRFGVLPIPIHCSYHSGNHPNSSKTKRNHHRIIYRIPHGILCCRLPLHLRMHIPSSASESYHRHARHSIVATSICIVIGIDITNNIIQITDITNITYITDNSGFITNIVAVFIHIGTVDDNSLQ